MRRSASFFLGLSVGTALLASWSLMAEEGLDQARLLLEVALPMVAVIGIFLFVLDRRIQGVGGS